MLYMLCFFKKEKQRPFLVERLSYLIYLNFGPNVA